MTESSLVRETAPARRNPRRGTVAIVLGVVVLVLVALAAWWLLAGRGAQPDWDRVTEIDLRAPAGDAFAGETPWVMLQLQPGRPDTQNAFRLSLVPRQGTPAPGAATSARIAELTTQPVGSVEAPLPIPLRPEEGATGALVGFANMAQPGWWRLSVTVDGGTLPADYYVLIPDPNINGPGAVAKTDTSADAEAVYRQGLAAMTSLRQVQFTQWMADGQGNGAISHHAVSAGGDGAPPGFIYQAAGGMKAVIIGSTRWVQLPDDLGWTKQEGAISVPPAEWGKEYQGATGFTLLGEETIDGEQTQIVAFLVPEVTEPQRQTAAWYLWWVGVDSGEVRREAMVSRLHYMLNRFEMFNEPFALEPPVLPATPPAGTPGS